MEEELSFQQIVLRKLDTHAPKNEGGPLPYAIHKNEVKMGQRLKC